jgi:hypothetical protein
MSQVLDNFDAKADRLAAVIQRIGFCIWQLQDLEGSAARFLVLMTQLTPLTSEEEGAALVERASGRTFGATLRGIAQADLLPDDIQGRFNTLLSERNWLVHNSRATSRDAIPSDTSALGLIERIDAISSEALALHREIDSLFNTVAENNGLSAESIEQAAQELLHIWHSEHTA